MNEIVEPFDSFEAVVAVDEAGSTNGTVVAVNVKD